MEIFINNHASIPIYEQISSQIKSMIISGELTAGEALPSIRGLAKSLHISVLTVQKAYDVLQTDGFIETTAGKGCFVSAQNQDFYLEEQQKKIENHFTEAIEIAKVSGIKLEKTALELSNVSKQYKDFTLDNISFKVPQGSIVGLIGENGAGKSTTINAVLGLISKDSGTITMLGKTDIDAVCKENIGVVFDGNNYPDMLTPKQLGKVFENIYSSWNKEKYEQLLKKFNLPLNKKIKKFSKGMKMKYAISVAFSHNSKLLILDEATSGLDPIMRDEILDMFLDFIQDEENSILVSSHITSDLEKVADYIVFIHNGKIVFSKPKDELLENYGIIKCGASVFDEIDKDKIITYRKQDYEWQILVDDRKSAQKQYPKALIVPASIDEIMLMYVRGEVE